MPLFDRAGWLPDEPVPRPDPCGEPFFPEAVVDMFLYMLGNVITAIGRNEVVPGSNRVIMVRDVALVGLLLAEQGLASTRAHTFGNPFPFTKRLRPYLSDENALLEALPPVETTIDSMIKGFIAQPKHSYPGPRPWLPRPAPSGPPPTNRPASRISNAASASRCGFAQPNPRATRRARTRQRFLGLDLPDALGSFLFDEAGDMFATYNQMPPAPADTDPGAWPAPD